MINRIAESETAEFVWANRLETLYIIFSVYCGSAGMQLDKVSKMQTAPHSLQSFIAVNSFWTKTLVKVINGYPFSYEQIANDATAFDTTVAFPSFSRFYKSFKNPCY